MKQISLKGCIVFYFVVKLIIKSNTKDLLYFKTVSAGKSKQKRYFCTWFYSFNFKTKCQTHTLLSGFKTKNNGFYTTFPGNHPAGIGELQKLADKIGSEINEVIEMIYLCKGS